VGGAYSPPHGPPLPVYLRISDSDFLGKLLLFSYRSSFPKVFGRVKPLILLRNLNLILGSHFLPKLPKTVRYFFINENA